MLSALADPVNIIYMECNKDEATRAKLIAESKLEQKDYLGAKKLTLKAQALYPDLNGITQLLTTLDVYLSSDKIRGEVDWYRVLCVNPSDDYDTIKKQFRKLALKLHPDKNTSVGADGAFKLISEAWNLLSDKEKRAAYNQRRGYGGVQKTVPTHSGGPSAPCGAWNYAYTRPGQQNVPSAPRQSKKKVPSVPSQPSQQKVPGHTGGPSAAAHTADPSSTTSTHKSKSKTSKKARTQNPASYHVRSDAFWTVCHGCNTHFEYLKMYCNYTLLCRICDKPFLALEIAPPVFSKSAKPTPWVRREHSHTSFPGQNARDPKGKAAAAQNPGAGQTSPKTSPSSFVYTNCQQGPLPETANTAAEKPDNAVLQARDSLKRPHTESHAPANLEKFFKKVKLDAGDSNGYRANHNMAQGDFGAETAHGTGFKGFSAPCCQPSSTKDETRKLLVSNTQKEILKKLSDSNI